MRFEKKYDSDIKYEYQCDKCDVITEVWAGKNTFYRNKPCPNCENGYLSVKGYESSGSQSAAISYSYGKEKQIQWMLDRTEKQRAIGKKLGF